MFVTLVVLPGGMVAAAIALFLRALTPGWRLAALAIVAAPTAMLALDADRSIASLARGQGIDGSTALTRALRALPDDPQQLEIVRGQLRDGADPREAGEDMPLALAIRAVPHVGPEAMRLLLDSGADPNAPDLFGKPVWFEATWGSMPPTLLPELLERGANPMATERDGHSAVWTAVTHANWPAALLLLNRGASIQGISPMSLSLDAEVESWLRSHPGDAGAIEVLAAIRRRGGR